MTWLRFSPTALNMLIKQGLLKGLFAVRAFLRLFNTVIFMEREFGLIKEFGAEFAFYLTVGFFFVFFDGFFLNNFTTLFAFGEISEAVGFVKH